MNSMKETQMNVVECPPLEYPNQSLDNNAITQECDEEIPPLFSSERRIFNESGGTTPDRNNDSGLMSQVLGTPADISHGGWRTDDGGHVCLPIGGACCRPSIYLVG